MEKTWTSEPWCRGIAHRSHLVDGDWAENGINYVIASDGIYNPTNGGDLDRIVQCVNGCRTIPNPETTIPAMVEALKLLIDTYPSDVPEEHMDEVTAVITNGRQVLAMLDNTKEGE